MSLEESCGRSRFEFGAWCWTVVVGVVATLVADYLEGWSFRSVQWAVGGPLEGWSFRSVQWAVGGPLEVRVHGEALACL